MVVLYLSIFVLYLSCTWFVLPLHFCYIFICIKMFVRIISMFIAIWWITLYIYSLVVLHIGKHVMYISWFILPLLPSSLSYIHNILLTLICLNLPYSFHIHWHTSIHYWYLNISYIYLYFKVFLLCITIKAALHFSYSTL